MKYKAFLFDLDGTLVDTHQANYMAYFQSIKNIIGADFDERELYQQITNGTDYRKFLPLVVQKITEKQIELVGLKKAEIYPAYLKYSVLNKNLIDFIKLAIRKKIKIVLVTTAKEKNALAVLHNHKIADLFNLKIFGDDFKNLKPSPDIYLKALAKLNLKPQETRAFEDSVDGISAAKAAGIEVSKVSLASLKQIFLTSN